MCAFQRAPAYGAAGPSVNFLVHQALLDRLQAHDVPGLDAGETHVLVAKQMTRARLELGASALPKVDGIELELATLDDIKGRADRRRDAVSFVFVDDPQIRRDAASLTIGTDLALPRNSGMVQMCCCDGRGEFKKANGLWVFVRWSRMRCS